MATPPPPFDPLGLSLFHAKFRPDEPARPPSGEARANERPKASRRASVAQIVCWVVGGAGYIGLLVASHGSSHADDLRGLAVAWLLVFGAVNAYFILKHR
jgi:hypothetical protein